MKLNDVFTDDSAVSPVIGVVLMVAITIILAGTVGLMVTQMDDLAGDSATSTVGFDYESSSADTANITVTSAPTGENALDHEDFEVTVDGNAIDFTNDSSNHFNDSSGDTMAAGDSVDIHINDVDSVSDHDFEDRTVRIIYTGGGSSKIIGEHTF